MYIIILATKEIFYFNLSLFSNFICLFLALFHCWVPFLIMEEVTDEVHPYFALKVEICFPLLEKW